ncbi:MAG: ferritin [Calditerrivibrio sp.]|nr:ferritin [Calditerrivibrio sp.]MCA1932532.1 ferritin [Calditerrivibrio sp.]MCA1980371.1 ferritin [Calditerrivibrio sp.]
MITKKMAKALNEQIKNEIFSSYLYLSMSAWSSTQGLKGFANWFYIQSKEEMVHAIKFYHYVLDQGEPVELHEIPKPEKDFKNPVKVFEEVLKHEQFITKSIYGLVDLALEEKDHATNAFLQWFVTEQVEEEANVNSILDQLKLTKSDGNGIFMIDKELATRTFVLPAGVTI